VSAALHSHDPKRIDLLLAHCAELPKAGARMPVFERLRDKIGAELARVLLFALAGNQRTRFARRRG
jgi:hypothetical protein